MRGKALILSEAFGGGHTRVARAVAASLNGWQCSIYEMGYFLHPKLTSQLTKNYLLTIQKAPWIWKKLYSSSLSESNVIPFIYQKIYFTKLSVLLLQHNPDIIIATHPFPAAAISAFKKRGVNIPLIGVTTDFHVHPSWSLADWDILCTPSTSIPEWISRQHCTLPTGIPVMPAFHLKSNKKEARSILNLDANRPVALWMGGSQGIHKKMNWIHNIPKDPSIQWIFVAGHNDELFGSLSTSLGGLDYVRLFKYTEDISLLMDAADLIITKAGGVTCSEAIQKELPIILGPSLSGQEAENVQFLLQQGLAMQPLSSSFWLTLKEVISNPQQLHILQGNIRAYKQSTQPRSLYPLIEFLTSKGGVVS
ncbi:glycosyltransferase [Ammoniphilus sp. YIM 78166]|uniref:MGDG synthase family glycosyltransferase n=1 Tax=Ammoniphilus sp. YIM 78166 TaxID=1644106 RepID=UPI00106F6B7A|nr:glycosyltransferase [Ammoniphilus sp. YIM 78166]